MADTDTLLAALQEVRGVSYRISVHTFVEFLLKSGDIDNRVRAASENAMREGSRIHRLIQKSRGPSYQAEVPLSFTHDTGRYTITIEGRADGIAQEDSFVKDDAQLSFTIGDDGIVSGGEVPDPLKPSHLIEEIKCTYRNVAKMEAPVPVHLAQAKCYAHFLCAEEGLAAAGVCMTYYNLDTAETRMFREDYSAKALETWFDGMLRLYLKWSDYQYDWEQVRTASIRETEFPFAYRKGQRELAGAVYSTIVHKKKLFLEAPTGSGKTLAVLFPSVKAIGEGKARRLFYLTARTTGRRAPEEAFDLMRAGSGLRFKTVTITAKEKACCNSVCDCNPDACPYAKGHFDRVNDAIYDCVLHEDALSREVLDAYAKKHTVCPFEFALDMSLFADGIICDYNYLFDPFVYLRRFFADANAAENLFLVDEAHNLAERGRVMYSAHLSEERVLSVQEKIRTGRGLRAVRNAVRTLADVLGAYGARLLKAGTPYLVLNGMTAAEDALTKVSQALSAYLDDREVKHDEQREILLSFYLDIFRFRTIAEELDEDTRCYLEFEKDDTVVLHILRVNPSRPLARCMERGISSVLFSATLLPVQYYKSLLGGMDEDYEVYAETSFDPGRCQQIVVNDVTSKYTERSAATYVRIAQAIRAVVEAKKGNYMVFFPSYVFLQEVLFRYRDLTDENTERLIVQEKDMTEEDRERFMEAFRAGEAAVTDAGNDGPALSMLARMGIEAEVEEDVGTTGFCVLGGIFSEGIDLPGGALIGACIVGTGLPQTDNERDILRAGFDEAGVDGFDYAYRFPGMNRVLQAAGRVIRTQEDVGVVALLDHRFLETRNRSLFPREWQTLQSMPSEAVNDFLIRYWAKWEEPS